MSRQKMLNKPSGEITDPFSQLWNHIFFVGNQKALAGWRLDCNELANGYYDTNYIRVCLYDCLTILFILCCVEILGNLEVLFSWPEGILSKFAYSTVYIIYIYIYVYVSETSKMEQTIEYTFEASTEGYQEIQNRERAYRL